MSPLQLEFSVEDGLAAWTEGSPEPRLRTILHWPEQDRLAELARSIVRRELPDGTYTLHLHLVSDAAIRTLNAEHRGKDSPTDVLSFPLHGPDFVLPPGEPVALGDVVVSYPRALAQAEEYGHSVERELAYLLAHGVLHVLGFDHEAEDEQREMRRREEEALQPLGFTR